MAAPKKRTSHSRKRIRNSCKTVAIKHFINCKNCGSQALPHHICTKCGYRGKKSILVENDKNIAGH